MNEQQLTSQYIAAYCDNEFRKGLKGISETETDQRLDAIIRLFCCLHSRDVFVKSYSKHLANRLLNKTSISDDAEQLMLSKLKVECGLQTVNKMSHMFTDMQLSKQLMGEFKTMNKGTEVAGIQVNVEVLTNGHWPEQNAPATKLPIELTDCSSKFEMFYKNKHNGRHLTWIFNHGHVELTPQFTLKKYTLTTTLY
jgi:hypothetical protein